jgi:DNA-binding beta-propeller fold protein YncE
MQSNTSSGSSLRAAERAGRARARAWVFATLAWLASSNGPACAQSLVLQRTIELPSVHGRIDHLAVDADGGRLFVAALGSDSLEVVDLRAGKRVDRITSLHEPQGALYLDRSRRVVVANGSGGGVQAFADARAPAVASQAALDDADNLRLDPSTGQIYVGYGRALAALDPDTLQVLRRIDLQGHPESFQIEPSGRRIYVNVPEAGHVAVIERASGKVVATWGLDGAARNFPMALDESGHRLFVATRRPARLIAFDTESGRQTDRVAVCGDADDLFLDPATHRIFVVCGEGEIDVVRDAGESLALSERIPTAAGARTGLLVPRLSTLFVAVPARAGSAAEIRAYAAR